MQQLSSYKKGLIKKIAPFSILLAIATIAFSYSYANLINWKYLFYVIAISSFLSIFSPWFLKINSKHVVRKTYSKIYIIIIKTGISIVFSLVMMMTILDIINGPIKYTGECLVKLTSGGGGPKVILTANNDAVGIGHDEFLLLSSERINTKGRFYKCDSNIEIVYLRNLEVGLSLQKIN